MDNRGLFLKIKDFVSKIDAKSWPAFGMFFIVLSAAGALNYVGMVDVVGNFAAVTIALFFGFGVLSWHIVESRVDDSEYQEDVAMVAKWFNAIADGLLLVVNLFRAQLHMEAVAGMTWADTLAFIIIGLSAVSHVTAFLLWTQNDPRRFIRKEGERAISEIGLRSQRANNSISAAEAELKARKWVMDEERRLRAEYSDLPQEQVNKIVSEMKSTVYKELEKRRQAGQAESVQQTRSMKPQERPQAPQTPKPAVALASETKVEALAGHPNEDGGK